MTLELPLSGTPEAKGYLLGEAESWAASRGYRWIAGVDEAGRGPLAGPVVAACVILDPDLPPPEGLDDSKQLSAAQREKLELEIREKAVSWAIASASPERIDSVNILRATLEAMSSALEQLQRVPELVLVDGNVAFSTSLLLKCLVKGDQRSFNVAAASILAKVERDRQMTKWDLDYPGYGFARHKGYATAEHLAALERLGPCPIHRRTFRGVLPLP